MMVNRLNFVGSVVGLQRDLEDDLHWKHPPSIVTWWVDGQGWNGHNSKTSVVNDRGFRHVAAYGKLTNNEVEYTALMEALAMADDGDVIYTDSQLIQRQMSGEYKIRNFHMQLFHDSCMAWKVIKPNVMIEWVRREDNKAGRLLEDR